MEPLNNEPVIDAAPDQLEPKKQREAEKRLDNYLVGISPIATALQSSNFQEGTTGWRLNSNGEVQITGKIPASATAVGVKGTIAVSTTHIYVCTATNTWKRVAIATW